MQLYALHDTKPNAKPFKVREDEARSLNALGYGIFWTPNQFYNERRIENLQQIDYWYVETDKTDKDEALRLFEDAPVQPTMVIESKAGFHVYWRAQDAGIETWDEIVRWRLVPTFSGDRKAADVTRLLRAPGFYHQKVPSQPFLVRKLFEDKHLSIREQEMFEGYVPVYPPPRVVAPRKLRGNSFWQRVSELDCRDAVGRFSGHWLCKGERFDLEEQYNGNANIIRLNRDGSRYSTGSFVDRDGRLGCVDGGSSIAAWLHWYGWTWGEVAKGIVEEYPEVDE
jgi:hypothetical protein